MNAAALTHQRACGAARIEFEARSDGRTVLADLYQCAPCRVLFPEGEEDDPVQAVLLTTTGGLTGGDRVCVDVDVRAGARAAITTQAAEKIYRALPDDDPSRVDITMTVGSGSWAEWLAQETILFNRARLRREFRADVSNGGRLLAVESLVMGRTAMGECFDSGFIHDAWRIRRAGRLIWADGLHMDADITALRTARFGFGTAVACSTLVYVGDDISQQLAMTRKLLSDSLILRDHAPSITAAATALEGLLLVRLLADHPAQLRSAVMELISRLRQSAGGLPARLPRVWHC